MTGLNNAVLPGGFTALCFDVYYDIPHLLAIGPVQ
ncbi:hypothetical protein KIS4809_1313 [Bacillus sp. ZZV12-4809]|nr:hypothetical protein KIS4809_1313 [Bacillus sp. ZZV12-4809]